MTPAGKVTPADCLTFRVPWSDIEIISFIARDETAGIAYHPRIMNSAIPWSSACPHCLRGKLTKLRPGTRQAIRVLCSARRRRPSEYQFILSPHYLVLGKSDKSGWMVKVIQQDKNLILDVIQLASQPPVFNGPMKEFRSTIVNRGLKLILSGRAPLAGEVGACVRDLREMKPPIPEIPCWKWARNL